MIFDPQQLAALSAVLRNGSFDAAAEALAVTPSAISQRIKALEERMGTTLVRRASPCTATAAGARLAKHAEDVGLLEAQVARDLALRPEDQPPRLRIAVNADSLATWFVPALAEVPDLLFDLLVDDQDHSADWLRSGEVSAAITAAGRPVQGCDRIPLGALRYVAVASPDFMHRWFAEGITARSLARAPCLSFNAKDALQKRWIETATGQRLSAPAHLVPSTHAFLTATQSGMAWGLNPETLVRDLIRRGDLVALRPNLPLDTPLDWQVSRIMAPVLKPVTRAIVATARQALIAAA